MKSLWDLSAQIQENNKLRVILEKKNYSIGAEAGSMIKRMSEKKVVEALKSVYPHYVCCETSGPYDDYYVVYSGIGCTAILGTGDTKMDATRDALRKVVWEKGEYVSY